MHLGFVFIVLQFANKDSLDKTLQGYNGCWCPSHNNVVLLFQSPTRHKKKALSAIIMTCLPQKTHWNAKKSDQLPLNMKTVNIQQVEKILFIELRNLLSFSLSKKAGSSYGNLNEKWNRTILELLKINFNSPVSVNPQCSSTAILINYESESASQFIFAFSEFTFYCRLLKRSNWNYVPTSINHGQQQT